MDRQPEGPLVKNQTKHHVEQRDVNHTCPVLCPVYSYSHPSCAFLYSYPYHVMLCITYIHPIQSKLDMPNVTLIPSCTSLEFFQFRLDTLLCLAIQLIFFDLCPASRESFSY